MCVFILTEVIFTGGFVSCKSFDETTTSIVPVIASFDATGHVKPLYVRLGRTSFKICDYFVSSKYSGITEFRCTISAGASLRPLQLSYYSSEGMWTIPYASDKIDADS